MKTVVSAGAVQIKNLVKTYLDDRGRPTFTAVKKINLHIENGEFMVLVGPSGCGKTPTLRMAAGLEKITSGTLSIGDRVVNELEPKDRVIAMVFQNYALYPHMTIFNNMAFGLQLAKKKKDFISETVGRTSKALGLDKMLERKPEALSGGQRQRVALGRAIVRAPGSGTTASRCPGKARRGAPANHSRAGGRRPGCSPARSAGRAAPRTLRRCVRFKPRFGPIALKEPVRSGPGPLCLWKKACPSV